MITDILENAPAYFNLSPRIATALQFLVRPDLSALPLGRHPIQADRIFALIQEYSTRPPEQCFWEAHRRYTDVQFLHSGTEAIGWSPIQRMNIAKEYDADKDFAVLEGDGQIIHLQAGSFAILYPHDAHQPCLAAGAPQTVRKIVIKVAIN